MSNAPVREASWNALTEALTQEDCFRPAGGLGLSAGRSHLPWPVEQGQDASAAAIPALCPAPVAGLDLPGPEAHESGGQRPTRGLAPFSLPSRYRRQRGLLLAAGLVLLLLIANAALRAF